MTARAAAFGSLAAFACAGPAASQAVPQVSLEDRLAIGAAVHGQVSKCWKPATVYFGLLPRIRVTFALKRDGSLDGPPRLIEEGSRGITPEHAAAAISAIESCAPYELPARHFDYWRRVLINFDHGFARSASPSPQ